MKSSKKILFILPTFHTGGSENYALRFINYCGSEKHEWHALSPNLERGDLHDEFAAANCALHYRSLGYINPIKSLKLYTFFKKEKFDVVCTFNGNFGGLALTIAKLAGIEQRIAWHRRSSDAFGNNPLKKLYNTCVNRLIRSNATAVLSNSKHALDKFYSIYYQGGARFKVIPNGVNAEEFQTPLSKPEARKKMNIAEDVFLVGHVGRYDPAKNHKTIFKVAAELVKTEPNVRFLFCGKNTDSPSFKKRLKAHGIENICFAIGLSGEVPTVLKSMDLFYFPSLTEGQPNAMIEAMVAGVPVLTSNIPPVLEALPAKAKEHTVEPENVEDAVSKITSLIADADLQNQCCYGEWAVKQFDLEKNFELFKMEFDE